MSPKPPYTILGVLGQGGYGTVYKIRDKSNRVYALKVFTRFQSSSNTLTSMDEILNTGIYENYYATLIDNPNVLTVYTFLGNVPQSVTNPQQLRDRYQYNTGMITEYGVMDLDLLIGLTSDVDRKKPFRLQYNNKTYRVDIRQIIDDIHNGLKCYHTQGYAHLDLKPGNIILVEKSGSLRAKINDFSLSETIGTSNIYGKMTLPYNAPEIQDGKMHTYEPSMDIYSLGIVLRELETGLLEPSAFPRPDLKTDVYLSEKDRRLIKQMRDRNPRKRPTWTRIFNKRPRDCHTGNQEQVKPIDKNINAKVEFILEELFKDRKTIPVNLLLSVFDIFYRYSHRRLSEYVALILGGIITEKYGNFDLYGKGREKQLYDAVCQIATDMNGDYHLTVATYGKTKREILDFIKTTLFYPEKYRSFRNRVVRQPENKELTVLEVKI